MKQLLGKSLDIKKIYKKFEKAFERIFNLELEKITENQLEEMIKKDD